MKKIDLVIHVDPLSANQMYIKGRTISQKYQVYKILVANQIKQSKYTYKRPIKVDIVVGLKNHKIRDVDNILKPLLDTLESLYYFEDDCLIYDLQIRKIPSKSNVLYITIKPINYFTRWINTIIDKVKKLG